MGLLFRVKNVKLSSTVDALLANHSRGYVLARSAGAIVTFLFKHLKHVAH